MPPALKTKFTSEELRLIEEHASIGGTVTEIAGRLGINARTAQDWTNSATANPAFHKAWHAGRWRFVTELRKSQFELATMNSQMAIHLGKHYLGQDDKPQEVHHLHRVVGTLPDYDATSADWQRKFAPDPVIDGGKLIEQEIEDAEIVGSDDPSSDASE